MDREIELEQGARPPAMAFYRIAPFEVEELQKQLKDLLDTCYICPSKAPFGVPVYLVHRSSFKKRKMALYECASTIGAQQDHNKK